MATGYYCTPTQIRYRYNTNEVTDLADDDGDATADSGVIEWIAEEVSLELYSYFYDRYSATALNPVGYTAGSATYPIVESMASWLSADRLKERQGMGPETGTGAMHPVIEWAGRVRFGTADIPGAT